MIRLENYSVKGKEKSGGLTGCNLSISSGDICAILSDSPDDARLFLRSLATLERPVSGVYDFDGKRLCFSDYRRLFSVKREIGYVAPDSALLSGRTLRDNLLLMRRWTENNPSAGLDSTALELCRRFKILDKLDERGAETGLWAYRLTVFIRELMKPAAVFLMELPEILFGHFDFETFIDVFNRYLKQAGTPVVLYTGRQDFTEMVANRHIIIEDGNIRAVQPE